MPVASQCTGEPQRLTQGFAALSTLIRIGAAATIDHHVNGKHIWELPLAPSYTSNPCQWRANAPGNRKGWRNGLFRTAAWSTLIRIGAAATIDHHVNGKHIWELPLAPSYTSNPCQWRANAPGSRKGWRKGLIRTAAWSTLIGLGAAATIDHHVNEKHTC